jgi:CheY-like chemotaxis protein
MVEYSSMASPIDSQSGHPVAVRDRRDELSAPLCDVLIVEDDRGIRNMIAEALDDEGYSVRVATHGRDGLSALEEIRPRLILLDIMMPVMDGTAFYHSLRRDPRHTGIPIVVMSAAHNLQLFQGAAQVVAMLPKPFVLTRLLEVVERQIGPP